jgi:LemA protein
MGGPPPLRPLPVASAPVVALWVLLAVVVLVALYLVVLYNGLVRLRNRIEGAWAQVDVQLRRRYDLIPNLVETVKAYASHERETLEAVIRARNAAVEAHGVAEQAQAENLVTGALRQLFALSESYPELKANEVFLNLQEELSATEGRIAYARQYYNDSVERYNTRIQSFPAVLVAGPLQFREREYFEADEGSRGPVRVDFGDDD